MNFIGVDIGSSTVKGAVLDLEHAQIGDVVQVPCPAPVSGLPQRHFELDPLSVAQAVRDVITRLIAVSPECAGIVSCSQMAGVVLADLGGGPPLSNYLSWRDQRGLDMIPGRSVSYFEEMRGAIPDRQWATLGGELKLGSSLCLLKWCQHQGRLPDAALPLMLGDFVWQQLADGEAATEFTNALGALNLETNSWQRSVMARLQLDVLNWPRLVSPWDQIGSLAIQGKVIPCFPSVGDHQCSLLGTFLEPGELSINVSTGSQISLLSDSYTPGSHQIRPYFEQRLLNTLTHLPAGRALNALVDILSSLSVAAGQKVDDPWPLILRAAAASDDSDLSVDLAFFEGPMGSRGSISNISIDNLSVGRLFRAAFQNMAENYAACAKRLSPSTVFNRLVLSGGLVRKSRLLRDFIGRHFECPIRVSPEKEESLCGLLVLALKASGRVSNLTEAIGMVRQARRSPAPLESSSS